MRDLEGEIRRIVSEMLSTRAAAHHGLVENVDPSRGTVKVSWDEDGTLSGWLPVAQLAAGNGFSVVCLPTPGTQVFCVPDCNDSGSMVVVGAVHSTASPPGQITPYKATSAIPLVPGEPTIMGPDGQFIRFPAGGGIQSRGAWMHDGTMHTSGDISTETQVTAVVDVVAGQNAVSLVTHRHIAYSPGATTSKPI